MGIYIVELSINAKEDLKKIYKSGNTALIKKIEKIFLELSQHPSWGTGKPEVLKESNGIWSRRLDKKNRLLYIIKETKVTVVVLSALGHYDDK